MIPQKGRQFVEKQQQLSAFTVMGIWVLFWLFMFFATIFSLFGKTITILQSFQNHGTYVREFEITAVAYPSTKPQRNRSEIMNSETKNNSKNIENPIWLY